MEEYVYYMEELLKRETSPYPGRKQEGAMPHGVEGVVELGSPAANAPLSAPSTLNLLGELCDLHWAGHGNLVSRSPHIGKLGDPASSSVTSVLHT